MLIEQKIIFHAQELILNKDVSEKVKFETPIQVGIIICVLLRRAVDEGSIKGVSICRRSPAVLYLFFTDECLLFVKGDLSAAETLKSLLAYERVSGQKINFQKSALCCNLTMNENLKASISDNLQVPLAENFIKYLELPMPVGRNKRQVFGSIRHRVWQRIKGWSSHNFSKGGK